MKDKTDLLVRIAIGIVELIGVILKEKGKRGKINNNFNG